MFRSPRPGFFPPIPMFYKYILSAAVLLSPWIFSLPMEGDWARQIKEQAVVALLALLLVYFLWFYNKCFACLLAYLSVFSIFRENAVSLTAWTTVLVFSGLYLFIQWVKDDLRWLKKAVAVSFGLVLGYGALQFFQIHPILSAVHAVIKLESRLYAKKVTRELVETGKLAEGEYRVEGKHYLKKIIYRKTQDGTMEVDLDLELPQVVQHLRVSGMFGNPNDWVDYILVSLPFIFYFLRKKQALILTGVAVVMVSAVVFIKYYDVGHITNEAGLAKSIEIRKTIYAEILEQYKERWFLGHGLGTFKVKFPEAQKMKTYGTFIYAHNDFLQFLYEAGLVGFLLLIGTVAAPLRNIRPLDKEKLILSGSLLFLSGSAMINFPAHIAPTMLVGMIAFSLLSRACGKPGADEQKHPFPV